MLRVAVCWSSLTRDSIEVVNHNKLLLDETAALSNNSIRFDHFCQFWNSHNKYPYTVDETIDAPCQIGDFIPDENPDSKLKIIDILEPKLTVTNSFKDMSESVASYIRKNDVDVAEMYDYFNFFNYTTIDKKTFKSDSEIYNWSEKVLKPYCFLINKLGQYYAFEKSVMLAKTYSQTENFDYDVILRMRYDTALLPGSNMSHTIKEIERATTNRCIVVQNFTAENATSDVAMIDLHRETLTHDVDLLTINQKIDAPIKYGIADYMFLGSSIQMYKLASNLFKNVSNAFAHVCPDIDLEFRTSSEILWFNEIHNKHIACVSSKLAMGIICYQSTNFNSLVQVDFDTSRYFNDSMNGFRTILPKINFRWRDKFSELYIYDTDKYWL